MKKLVICLLLLTPVISVATPPIAPSASPLPTCWPCAERPQPGSGPDKLIDAVAEPLANSLATASRR